MDMSREEYAQLVQSHMKSSPTRKNLLWAFLTGGGICTVGQLLNNVFQDLGCTQEQAGLGTSIVLIGAAALLTALGVFDRLAKHAGAGTLVPITGFANAVVSPAVEYRTEGLITGMGANMFKVAGPVLVYGVSASVLYGLLYWLLG